MVFSASVSTRGATAVIKLVGDLDETNAAEFTEKVEKAAASGAGTIVLDTTKLDAISSAGLRGLAFAAEKMPDSIDIVVVAPNPSVKDSIDSIDFDQSVTIADTVPE